MPIRTLVRVAFAATSLLVATVAVQSAGPVFWQVSTQAEFLKGDVVENIAIDSEGRLLLGPSVQAMHETTAPFLWALEQDPDGRLLVGSGNEGHVLELLPDGKARVFYDAPELEVHALARGPAGRSTSGRHPTARCTRWLETVQPRRSSIQKSATSGRSRRSRTGRCSSPLATRGPSTACRPRARATCGTRSRATHVTAVYPEAGGSAVIGTASPGQLLRVGRDGRAFVLLDTPFREVHTVRPDGTGTLYAVAFGAKTGEEARPTEWPTPAPAAPQPIAMVSTEITVTAVGDVPIASSTATPPSAPRSDTGRTPKGAVYRIAADGLWDQIWQSNDDAPYDVAFDAPGLVLVATGDKGKIFRVSGDSGRSTLIARVPVQQVTAIGRGAGDLHFVTSNPGKVYRLVTAEGARGSYLSDVRDASTVASWGTVRWEASLPDGASIEIATRTGNTVARRDMERVVATLHRRPRRGDREPQGPLHPVASHAGGPT